MTPVRPIIPGQTVMVTARAVNRSFRFTPTPTVVALLLYCLAVALRPFRIDVHELCWMSNHWHIVLTDRGGDLPAFIQKLHSLISRNLNAMRGTRGCNFEKEYTLLVEVDPESILRHCAYVLANPVNAGLVSRVSGSGGLHSGNWAYGQQIVAEKPKVGIWKGSAPGGSRGRRDRSVLPRVASFEPKPRVGASSIEAELEYARWFRAFQAAYRTAWQRWKRGAREVEFPFGTYLMRKRFEVKCAPALA